MAIPILNIDKKLLEASSKAVEKRISMLDTTASRKTLIESATAALVNSLRRHFREKEQLPHTTSGFPCYGKNYPKRYFWYGNHGTSIAESIRSESNPSSLTANVNIKSPPLARKLDPQAAPITPKRAKYLAIPASLEAASWRGMPRDFPTALSLTYSKTQDGHWLPSLVAQSKNSKSSATVHYWLVHQTNPRSDPQAMPSRAVQTAAVASALKTALRKLFSP